MNRLATTADLRGPTGFDRGAREALLRVIVGSGVQHNALILAFFAREAYGSMDDYLDSVRKAHGAEAEVDIRSEMQAMTERYTDGSGSGSARGQSHLRPNRLPLGHARC